MKRPCITQSTKIRILHRDNYTCQKCGFNKINTMLNVPHQFIDNFEMFIIFKSIITSDRLVRVLKYVDNGGDVSEIVFEWQSTDGIEIDHIKAVCNGGGEEDSNLRCLCKKCHKLKTDTDLAELSIKRANHHYR